MKPAWDETVALRCNSALALRAYTSRLIGSDPALVLHGGGNTSLKLDGTLYVKGTGSNLAEVGENDFTAMDLAALRALLADERLPDAELTEHQAALEVCQRVPKAVLCLLSALQFHQVGTQMPHELWIALPPASQTPAVSYPKLRIARLSGAAYSEDIETVTEHGAPIRVYGVAKTITDCFKFRNKIGLDVALEALREAWAARRVTMDELWSYAVQCRVANVMRPYMEAVAHE